jgi:hypothetical protein
MVANCLAPSPLESEAVSSEAGAQSGKGPDNSERGNPPSHREINSPEETVACREATVGSLECKEQGPKKLQSGAECQIVPTEEVAVKSSEITKKRPRG